MLTLLGASTLSFKIPRERRERNKPARDTGGSQNLKMMLRSRQLDSPLLGGRAVGSKNVMPNDGSKIANRERVASVMGGDKSVCTSGGVV